MNIYLDIETLPCSDPDLIAELTADIKHPGSMKKYDTIQTWEREERPKAVADAVAKTALDGTYGRLCVIGWAIDDEEPLAIVSSDERELLKTFYIAIDKAVNRHDGRSYAPIWVGHAISSFDLPFLRKRSIIQGVRPPYELEQAMRARAWDDRIADTMLMWDSDRDKRISLDKLCKVLGIPSPKANGIDGSQVAAWFAAGAYEALGEYCVGDVTAARRVYKALTFQEVK